MNVTESMARTMLLVGEIFPVRNAPMKTVQAAMITFMGLVMSNQALSLPITSLSFLV